ncbi:MAG: hypothetical protein WBG43_06115, partial [Marinifilaceae bacterium]
MPKIDITENNIDELLGSLGYLFPSNEKELERFDKLYSDYQIENNKPIDPKEIMSLKFENDTQFAKLYRIEDNSNILKMVARKGNTI